MRVGASVTVGSPLDGDGELDALPEREPLRDAAGEADTEALAVPGAL